MPKYKVGNVAALFQEPKEPTTEAGKKLQSLFKEFHTKKNKYQGSSLQNAGSQTATMKSEGIKTEIENERLPKRNKKRKFNDTQTSQSFIEEQNTKKFKQEEPKYVKNSMLRDKKNKFPTEQSFPRKKKISNTGKNKIKNFNELDGEENEHANSYSSQSFVKNSNMMKSNKAKGLKDKDFLLSNEVDQFLSEQGFSKDKNKFIFGKNKSVENRNDSEAVKNDHSDVMQQSNSSKSKKKKQKAIFIKKSKQTELVTSKPNIESKESKNLSNENFMLEKEITDLVEKIPKHLKKFNNKQGYQQSTNTSVNHVSENEDNKEQNEINDVESFKDDNSTNVKDFIRNKNFKKKFNNDRNFVKKSEQEIFSKELDFIKIPDIKSEISEDELSRTLFVGNLPLDTKKKALKELFLPFGEIENIRFHGNETDKAKIFSENGFKSKFNRKNYAADSVPGYIVYKNKESAIFALSLSGSLFKGHHITVDFASPPGSHKHYDNKRSIFIGNLPFDCKEDSLWELFSGCGRIENVRVVRDKETGIGKGFGFVQFSTVQSKENALSLEDLEIQGRSLRLKEISDDKTAQKRAKDAPTVKRSNTFKSHAIRIKKKSKDSSSRKSVTKIMKNQKKLHEKKKISSILLKSMKK